MGFLWNWSEQDDILYVILLLCEREVEICVSRTVVQPLILLLDTCAYIKCDFVYSFLHKTNETGVLIGNWSKSSHQMQSSVHSWLLPLLCWAAAIISITSVSSPQLQWQSHSPLWLFIFASASAFGAFRTLCLSALSCHTFAIPLQPLCSHSNQLTSPLVLLFVCLLCSHLTVYHGFKWFRTPNSHYWSCDVCF